MEHQHAVGFDANVTLRSSFLQSPRTEELWSKGQRSQECTGELTLTVANGAIPQQWVLKTHPQQLFLVLVSTGRIKKSIVHPRVPTTTYKLCSCFEST